jgi:hypothetical protein
MSNWFECKVRYQKIDEQGKVKNVSEPYLVDAVSFTEAEGRINQEMEPYISGEFSVTNIKLANYAELLPGEGGDRWYKCKVSYIAIDEERGLERKSNSYILVRASDLKQAYDLLEESMRGTVSDYEISAIQESPILDVFPYETRDVEMDNSSESDADTYEAFENENANEEEDINDEV